MSSAAMTDLERERAALIERNAAILRQLAVHEFRPPGPGGRSEVPGGEGGDNRRRKRGREGTPQGAQGVRSSSRIAALLSRQGGSAGGHQQRMEGEEQGNEGGGRASGMKLGSSAGHDLTASRPKPLPPTHPNSDGSPARAGTLRGTQAVASADLEPWLGEEVASAVNPPKASSVALLSRGSPDGQPPKFSKYSGVAEMEDAIAVFVNLTKGSGDVYDNTFSMGGRRGPPMGGREKRGAWKARLLGRRKGISTRLRGQGRLAGTLEGQRMSWFASSRMHEQTPAVQRMLKTLPESGEEGGGERVVLFLREAGCYYTYCGEVRAAAWAPGSHPLQLVWELQRFDDLVEKAAFRALLGPAVLPPPS